MKRFSATKYLNYRRYHDGNSEEAIEVMKATDTMLECDGWTIDEVNKKKCLCLDEWCDDEIDLVQIVSDFFHV